MSRVQSWQQISTNDRQTCREIAREVAELGLLFLSLVFAARFHSFFLSVVSCRSLTIFSSWEEAVGAKQTRAAAWSQGKCTNERKRKTNGDAKEKHPVGERKMEGVHCQHTLLLYGVLYSPLAVHLLCSCSVVVFPSASSTEAPLQDGNGNDATLKRIRAEVWNKWENDDDWWWWTFCPFSLVALFSLLPSSSLFSLDLSLPSFFVLCCSFSCWSFMGFAESRDRDCSVLFFSSSSSSSSISPPSSPAATDDDDALMSLLLRLTASSSSDTSSSFSSFSSSSSSLDLSPHLPLLISLHRRSKRLTFFVWSACPSRYFFLLLFRLRYSLLVIFDCHCCMASLAVAVGGVPTGSFSLLPLTTLNVDFFIHSLLSHLFQW